MYYYGLAHRKHLFAGQSDGCTLELELLELVPPGAVAHKEGTKYLEGCHLTNRSSLAHLLSAALAQASGLADRS